MKVDDRAVLRIGAWRVDPAINEISSATQTHRLEPRTMRLLLCLAANAGRVVDLPRLLDEVWPGVVVTSASVYQAIAQLRRLLGDDAEQPTYIDTVSRRGYRLVAKVGPWVDEGSGAAATVPSADAARAAAGAGPAQSAPTTETAGSGGHRRGAGSRRRLLVMALISAIFAGLALVWFARLPTGGAPASGAASADSAIAVLPFLDLSEHHDQEYFALGMAEQIIDLLVKIPQLKVIGHTSSFKFKDQLEDLRAIGEKLGVPYLLEGSVRKSGNRVRVTAQLIRATDRYHLWSNTYDRDLSDVFQVQDEIADAVVSALQLRLLPSHQVSSMRRSANTEAYNQYLLGRQQYYSGTVGAYQHAAEAYQEAVRLDPGFAAAFAGLAVVTAYGADNVSEKGAVLARSMQAANRAVALAPDLADGYSARAFIRATWTWDWSGALEDARRALALDPRNSEVQRRYGAVLGYAGRLAEAIVALKRAAELDPLIEGNWAFLGFYLNADGQYAAARTALKRAINVAPESLVQSRFYLGVTELLDGRPEVALAAFRESRTEALRSAGIALAEHSLGHAAESQAALAEAIVRHADDSAYFIAAAYAWRDERAAAFAWLDRAFAQREVELSRVKVDPLLAHLRRDARFTVLMKRMDLAVPPEY